MNQGEAGLSGMRVLRPSSFLPLPSALWAWNQLFIPKGPAPPNLRAGTQGPPGPHLIVLSREVWRGIRAHFSNESLLVRCEQIQKICCQWTQYSQSFFQVVHVWYPVGIQTWKWVLKFYSACWICVHINLGMQTPRTLLSCHLEPFVSMLLQVQPDI